MQNVLPTVWTLVLLAGIARLVVNPEASVSDAILAALALIGIQLWACMERLGTLVAHANDAARERRRTAPPAPAAKPAELPQTAPAPPPRQELPTAREIRCERGASRTHAPRPTLYLAGSAASNPRQ